MRHLANGFVKRTSLQFSPPPNVTCITLTMCPLLKHVDSSGSEYVTLKAALLANTTGLVFSVHISLCTPRGFSSPFFFFFFKPPP